jgi:uncharacterized coiled-coil DUF342 family protein
MKIYRKERDKYKEKILELQDKQTEELTRYFDLRERKLTEIDNQFKLNVKISLSSAALVKVV